MFVFLMFRIPKTTKFLIFFYLFFNVFLSISQANEDVPLHNIVQYESPKPISSIVFEDFLGNDVNLNDYIGSLVIINFWATWCAPCKEEMPSLDSFYQDNNFNNLVVFAVNMEQPNTVKTKIKLFGAQDSKILHQKFLNKLVHQLILIKDYLKKILWVQLLTLKC